MQHRSLRARFGPRSRATDTSLLTPPPPRLGNRRSSPTLRRAPLLLAAVALVVLAGAATALIPRPAEAQTTVWSATLTVGDILPNVLVGCDDGNLNCSTVLTDDSFGYAGTSYRVTEFQLRLSDGNLAFGLDKVFELDALSLIVGGETFPMATAHIDGNVNTGDSRVWDNSGLNWSVGDTVEVSLVAPAPPASAAVSDPTLRSWPLTEIADEGPTEWWFPIGRGVCDMHDGLRPWTWERHKPPTADRCGWLSIPDVRADLEEPVDETAFKVYTALLSSPDISGRASVYRPRGPSVKLAVWAVYPREYDGRTVNATRRLQGPYDTPITVCLPGADGQALHGFDEAAGQWVKLESVEAERAGHVCGLHAHDLGLLVVSGD